MKNFTRIIFVVALTIVWIQSRSQTNSNQIIVTPYEWDQLKSSGNNMNNLTTWDPNESHRAINPVIHSPLNSQSISNCSGILPIDSTWAVVPFTSGTSPYYRNDDGSSPLIVLPFSFCFYGSNYTQVYINNNGNISFDNPYPVFSPVGLQGATVKMIAPFWADVDTRNISSGIVYYKVTPTALLIRWDSVGYYSTHVDKVNDLQCIITNGTDPLVSGGNNVKFSFGVMQWTTGDASADSAGFCPLSGNGYPGVSGASNADNINYIQFGQFGRPGSVYNTQTDPYPYSGVSYLNNRSYTFSTCGSTNIPPVVNWLTVCDTIHICLGDTLNVPISFLSPENNQVTTDTATSTMNSGFSIINQTSGNTASITTQVIGSISNLGYQTITFSATDNGIPPATTIFPVTLWIDSTCGCSAQFTLYPDSILQHTYWAVNLASGSQLSYLWSWGDSTYDSIPYPSHTYANQGFYNICLTVTDSNCTSTYCNNFNLMRSANAMVYVNVIPPNITTGLQSLNRNRSVSVFPNPNEGNFTLSCNLNSNNAIFKIMDITGRIVYQKNIVANNSNNITTSIDASLVNGIYYWEMIEDNNIAAKGKMAVIKQ